MKELEVAPMVAGLGCWEVEPRSPCLGKLALIQALAVTITSNIRRVKKFMNS